MKSPAKFLTIFSTILLVLFSVVNAEKTESMSFQTVGEGGVLMLNELGAVIVVEGENLVVQFVAPPDSRPKNYRSVDLESGDLIIMVNGRKMKSTADLKEVYKIVEIGQAVKMGIKRDKKLMIVSFDKADPAELPQRQMMVMSLESDSGAPEMTISSGSGLKRIKIGSDEHGIVPLLDIGLILAESDDGVIVKGVLAIAMDALGVEFAEGDIVKTIGGVLLKSVSQFSEQWEAIAVGDSVVMLILRDGKEIPARFVKPEGGERRMIIKNKEWE